MYGSLTFLPPSNFAVFDVLYFLQYCLQRAQIAQLNQLFQLLHLAHIYGHCFYLASCMLMSKAVNNDVSKDSPILSIFKHNRERNPSKCTVIKVDLTNKSAKNGRCRTNITLSLQLTCVNELMSSLYSSFGK